MRRCLAFLLPGLLAAVLGGCGRDAGARPALTVLAAASLTEALRDVADTYERGELRLSFAGSQEIAAQVTQGAPADVVATADDVTMARLRGGGVVDTPRPLATNRLVIVVARGNPHRIRGLADLARPRLAVVLAAPHVPAGRYAAAVLEGARVRVSPRSLEASVRGVTTKVRLGEADAGIGYATDVAADPAHLAAVAIPGAAPVRYLVAAVRASDHPTAAGELVRFLTSADARPVLARRGFGPP